MSVLLLFALLACRGPDAADPEPVVACAHPEWAGVDVRDALHVGEQQPFATLERALAAAGEGDIVAIHDGEYLTDPIEVDIPGLRLVGRCRDTVTLRSNAEGMRVTAPDVTVAGLTLADGYPQGVTFSGQDARVVHARVRDARGWGISSANVDITLEDVEVLDTQAVSEGSDVAIPVNIAGGRLDATDLLVDGSDGWGVYGNPNLDTRIVLRRTRVTNLWRFNAISGPTVTLEGGVELDHVVGSAISARVFQSTGDLLLHDIGWSGDGPWSSEQFAMVFTRGAIGPGLVADDLEAGVLASGGSFEVSGATVRRACGIAPAIGAFVSGGGTLTLRDVTIDRAGCPGVVGRYGAAVELERVRIDGARGSGIAMSGGRLTLAGVEVRDVRTGRPLEGVGVYAVDARVAGSDLSVADTEDYGLSFAGSEVALDDVRVQGASGAGVLALGSDVALERLEVRGVTPAAGRGWGGFGLYVGALDGEGTRHAPVRGVAGLRVGEGLIDDATGAGALVTDGVPLTLDGVTVSATRAGGDARGDGIVVMGGSTLLANGLTTVGNARVGVVFDASTGTLAGGALGETPGLVQQGCLDATPDVTVQGVSAPGGVVGCGEGASYPVAVPAPVWSDDVNVLE